MIVCPAFTVVICQAFLFLFNPHSNPVPFKETRLHRLKVRRIFFREGAACTEGLGKTGSREHPKKKSSTCEGSEERM